MPQGTAQRELTIEPTYKQHIAWGILHDDTTEEFLFGGGAGGGKTYLGCDWLVEMCMRYPNTRYFIARKRLKVLKQTTLVSLFKVLRKHGLQRDKDFKYNDQASQVTFSTGSTIDLLEVDFRPSDPDYEDLGSAEYTSGWVEEGGEIHEGAFDTLSVRVGRQLNDLYKIKGKIFITCNPKKNWLYRLFYKPWKDGKLPANRKFLQSLVGDNPRIDSGYIQKLKNIKNKSRKQRLLKGNWEYDDDPAALIDFEAIADLFTNTLEDEALEGRYMTVDVARYGDDLTVLKCWQGLKAYKVIVRSKQSTTITTTLIRDTAKEEHIPFSHIVVDEDGVGGGVVDSLEGVRGFIAGSSALEDTRLVPHPEDAPHYRTLKAQCCYMLADIINNHGMAVQPEHIDYDEEIDFEETLTEELEQIRAKDVDADDKALDVVPKKEVKEAIGRSPDFGDNLIMRMIFFLKMPGRTGGKVHVYKPGWRGFNKR